MIAQTQARSRELTPDESAALYDAARLAVLRSTGLLDSPEEEAFDRLARLASLITGMPIAQVNLVDDHRQFSKSCIAPEGWPTARDAPHQDSFCKWTIATHRPVVVADSRTDERVRGSAFVAMGLLTYLGIPLITADGVALGTLCVAGFEPHEWTEREVRLLSDLSTAVTNEIALRMDARARREMERIKDELVSIVAHELRTPLTSIRGSLGLLASGRLSADTPQARRMIEIAAQNSDRLVRLVNDMLDLERLESGTLELERTSVEAGVLVRQSVDAVAEQAAMGGVSIITHVEPGLVLFADADRVVQVLINLLSNAVKFSPHGADVHVSAERRGGEALFQVRDQGRGIPGEKLESIFGRFQQVDSSDARDRGGTGLGLAISRSIARQHGGRVWAASEVGRGSTFFLTVPVASTES